MNIYIEGGVVKLANTLTRRGVNQAEGALVIHAAKAVIGAARHRSGGGNNRFDAGARRRESRSESSHHRGLLLPPQGGAELWDCGGRRAPGREPCDRSP